MKRSGIVILVTFLSFASNILASDSNWLIGGIHYGGLLGYGIAGNQFDKSPGFVLEYLFLDSSGWGLALGTSAYKSKNWVKYHSIDAEFSAPVYLDVRKFIRYHNFDPFCSIGLSWHRVSLSGLNGSDNQLLLSTGFGVHIQLKDTALQFMAKPYAVFGNDIAEDGLANALVDALTESPRFDLKQNFGIELRVAYGYDFGPW